jgi:3-phosphoshikimate 1-carboxyvinyltransferase
MHVTVIPRPLSGKIKAIPSKSAAHRLLICAALADRATSIYCPATSRDILATAQCLQALGADIDYDSGSFIVNPIRRLSRRAVLYCGESGSTLRFLLPVVCALGAETEIEMQGSLSRRPLSPLWEELIAHGADLTRAGENIIRTSGRINPGAYRIPGDISSQFVSGLLFALPLLKSDSSIELSGTVQSMGYIEMTLRALRDFGVNIRREHSHYIIEGGCRFITPGEAEVEGDWSNAAVWLAARALSGEDIEVSGLSDDSLQGDRAAWELIERVRSGNAVIDVKNVPDLFPVLAVVAAVTPGRTEFINAGRLRIKECDRLSAVGRMLSALGGDCREEEDGMIIEGKRRLAGGTVSSENDHRMAMCAALAAIACENPVTILGAEAVGKSYPSFFEDYRSLGGIVK